MKLNTTGLLIIACLISFCAYGQENKPQDKEIGLSVFSYEMNGETLNHGLAPKFVVGPYFNKYFSNLSWNSSIEFGSNNINDECIGCNDGYYGIGKLTEFIVSTGLRFTFFQPKSYFIKPFIEGDIYYSYSVYKGDFGGGFTGYGMSVDNSFSALGFLGRAGLCIIPTHSISITVSSSFRAGMVNAIHHIDDFSESYSGLTTITPLQIRFGYLF